MIISFFIIMILLALVPVVKNRALCQPEEGTCRAVDSTFCPCTKKMPESSAKESGGVFQSSTDKNEEKRDIGNISPTKAGRKSC